MEDNFASRAFSEWKNSCDRIFTSLSAEVPYVREPVVSNPTSDLTVLI